MASRLYCSRIVPIHRSSRAVASRLTAWTADFAVALVSVLRVLLRRERRERERSLTALSVSLHRRTSRCNVAPWISYAITFYWTRAMFIIGAERSLVEPRANDALYDETILTTDVLIFHVFLTSKLILWKKANYLSSIKSISRISSYTFLQCLCWFATSLLCFNDAIDFEGQLLELREKDNVEHYTSFRSDMAFKGDVRFW